MPSPGALAPPRLPVEDTYLELLADTLESLDLPPRGQFLQRFLRTRGAGRFRAPVLEHARNQCSAIGLVIDDEYSHILKSRHFYGIQ